MMHETKIDIDKAALQFLKHKNENVNFDSTFEILSFFRENEIELNVKK